MLNQNCVFFVCGHLSHLHTSTGLGKITEIQCLRQITNIRITCNIQKAINESNVTKDIITLSIDRLKLDVDPRPNLCY